MGWSRAPFKAHGNSNPMLKPGKLLYRRVFYITFVNTKFNHLHLVGSRVAWVAFGVSSFHLRAAEELGAPGLVFFLMDALVSLAMLDFCELVERDIILLKGPRCYNDGYLNTQIVCGELNIVMEIDLRVEREIVETREREKGVS
ncbi:7-deoxyloganetin glucosyltransferase-like protein [Cinnamomum micranthum f. kanehirae]|uniref:7-deoxyloganetin glucosyltransferase-like protein n=1 Tax=Cinnamomum micranthum f. kanehirae TaxID=337451 RepID=A0A443PGN5_9MAGN|nr:7-deoxyloganetin glucosyltransferase-like protein [Cinnamomum micranthum f. kanehirae]